MNLKQWSVDASLKIGEEYLGNQLLAQNIAKCGYDAITREYVYVEAPVVKKSLQMIPSAWESFAGLGIDFGGGVGLISSTVALKPEVKGVYCVELVEDVVKLCQPIVKRQILGNDSCKVTSVIGDFNHIEMPDDSFDFALCWFSLHHSNDPIQTLREAQRVLKRGAHFCLVERAHNDSTPDSEIQRMLSIVYSKEFLERNYRSTDQKLTRKANGEHEYRYREWESFIAQAGFSIKSSVVIKTSSAENDCNFNDHGIAEVKVEHSIGCFGNKKVGYLLVKE